MSRILVTGGAGFIGSHLCRKLVHLGNNVICLDNLSSGSIENISDLKNRTNFMFIEHDVQAPYFFEVEQIYNLACPASPVYYQSDPIRTLKTNVLGAINALELAVKINSRLLQASTSEVYGDPLTHPQIESYWGNVNPIGERACYDEGKRVAESFIYDYKRTHNISIRVARIFNTYGPSMQNNDGRVISNFIVQALSGTAITVYGDGSQTRSFCYVDDTVEALIRLMNHQNTDEYPINIGNPTEISILEIAKIILKLTGSSSNLIFRPLPTDDPVRRKPDVNRARQILNWHSTTSLEDGIKNTIEYFQKKMECK